jgi:hypothetical protein
MFTTAPSIVLSAMIYDIEHAVFFTICYMGRTEARGGRASEGTPDHPESSSQQGFLGALGGGHCCCCSCSLGLLFACWMTRFLLLDSSGALFLLIVACWTLLCSSASFSFVSLTQGRDPESLTTSIQPLSKSSLSQQHEESAHLAYSTLPSSAIATNVPLFSCTRITPLHARHGQKRAPLMCAMPSLESPFGTKVESVESRVSRQCMLVLMPSPFPPPVTLASPDSAHSGRKRDDDDDEGILPPRAALLGVLEARPGPFFACPPRRGARELGSHGRRQTA